MKFKHTSGPWTMFDDCISLVVAKDEPDTKYKYKRIGMFFHDCNNEEEQLANQRLVMSSPEMLDALIELYKHVCYTCENCQGAEDPQCEMMIRYKDIIERATGMSIEEVLK